MGCWNGTCALSQLPILRGEEIVLFVIKKNNRSRRLGSGFSYADDLYSPLTLPIHAHYNEYGGVEGIQADKFSPIILQQLKEALPELKDTEVLEDVINELIARGEVQDVGLMMVRKDIWNAMFAYQSNADRYLNYEVASLEFYNQTDAIVEEAMRFPEGSDERKEQLESLLSSEYLLSCMRHDNDNDNDNDFLDFFRLKREYFSLILKSLYKPFQHLRRLLVEFIVFSYTLEDLRMSWSLQSGAGSQDSDTDPHYALAVQMMKSANDIQYRYLTDDLYEEEREEVEIKLATMYDEMETRQKEFKDHMDKLSL